MPTQTSWYSRSGTRIVSAFRRIDKAAKAQQDEQYADYAGQVDAINKSQLVAHYKIDGTLITANDNYLKTLDYSLSEVAGQHHSQLVEPSFRHQPEYKRFWEELSAGRFQAGEYKRVGKGQKEVWLQASYNPIFDAQGKPFKIVEFATDVSQTVQERLIYARYAGMVDNSPMNIMFTDRDFKLQYMNPASINTLKRLEKHLPVPVNQMIGQCIDLFHKHPSHQRQLLSDPKNLPRKAIIDVGPEKIDLLACPIFGPIKTSGDARDYLGAMVNWSIVTEKLSIDAIMTRASAMMNQMPAVIFADRQNLIQYMNESAIQMLTRLQGHLPVAVDKMVGQSVDIFHKNPAHQRRILADPSLLPRKTQITIGNEVLDLTINAVKDGNNVHLGSMITWDVVTEKLAQAIREKALSDSMQSVLASVAENSSSVAAASEELSSVSSQMSSNAESTASQASVVSAASEQVSRTTQSVASGIVEMSASITEIARNATEAARVAMTAVKAAENTTATISRLGESSTEIGKVIKVITGIAQQTNLLALNATIEAARAGEAGKGFAVVANEVKELAKETAKATEDISQKIVAIQRDTTSAVEAIAEITTVINQVNDISNTIASAVEEQTATTNEISRSVNETSKGTAEIVQSITAVAQMAKSTTEGARNSQSAADELARMAAELQELVSAFNAKK